MSRLDRHVSAVRNKLAVHRFVEALACTILVGGLVVLIAVLVERLGGFRVPATRRHLLIAAGVLFVGVVGYAIWRRPGERQAAVAIDRKLALDEKFSTALYVRSLNDPFARAAVKDAEHTAVGVRLDRQFPLTFPRLGWGAIAVVVLGAVTFQFLPQMDLFGHRQAVADKKKALAQADQDATRRAERVLEVVQAAPPSLQNNEAFQIKVRELKEMAKQGRADDPSRMSRKAEDVLKDVQTALKDEAERTQKIAESQTATLTQGLGDGSDFKSPVAKVEKAMASGDFSAAVQNLEKMVDQFDKMDDKDKKQAAKDMEDLAKKLANAAKDPKVQEQIQKQLQQMGADKQQAQKMADDMAKAAQGDKQAANNVQNQAKQMQQQLQNQINQAQQQAAAGNAQAAQQLSQLQQQQQQMNQAIQGMQGMANAQAQAGNMSQAAQQMAAGMKQSAQAGQQPGGQQQQPGQPAGQQPGNTAGQQQVAQGKQQMQQALGQMQAAQADANQAAARQQNAQQGGQNGNQPGDNGAGAQGQQANGQANPAGGKGGEGQGQFQPGDPNGNPGGGMGEAGIGNGQQTREKVFAPFTAKAEDDIGESREDGKILASTLVKGQVIKGESKAGLAKITESTEKAIADEVDEDHVAGLSRKAAEEYFRVMNQDAKK